MASADVVEQAPGLGRLRNNANVNSNGNTSRRVRDRA